MRLKYAVVYERTPNNPEMETTFGMVEVEPAVDQSTAARA